MKCPKCQDDNLAIAKFCQQCGTRLAMACGKCRSELPPSAKFCVECGERVAAAGSESARATSPETYTPNHLAEKILKTRSALEGERKQVTIVFADLKGSMELLADRDPEDARKILDPVLERMIEAVHLYEGTVNQVMGDGIMALFGAPLAHEDHAVRACYAALRMQDTVKRYAEEIRRREGVLPQIRVGLNSGEVVVRSIGSDLHMDYTAVGQTTHLAARMEQMAAAGSILLTADTLRLTEGYVEVRGLGPMQVKGLGEPLEIFELTGAGQARTRLQTAALRGLTRFVGRDVEIAHLRRVLGQAGSGSGQVIALVGEAGVGKSRLTYEFTHSHRVQDWLILEAASLSYGKATSYLPVIEMLRGYFTIGARDDQREMRAKVLGRVLELDRALEPLVPPLLSLLDLPVEDVGWQTLDPPQRRQRTLDAVKRLLLREAQVQPLLLVFEDLHWIDSETQALLDSLIESLGSARLLLLVNYRPEYRHGWGSKTYYTQIRLDPLPAKSAKELLDALFGDDPGLATLKQLLIKRGNPFFLEETVRTLVETNALAGERGRYRLTQPVQSVQVPPTVQAMLAARIDRLLPEDKRLLQVAAVVGKDVPFTLLHAIAELSDEALRGGLERLQASEFVYETGLFPDLEYTFKHALTHEVAYGGLLHGRRRELHGRAVAEIERLHATRLDEHIERLAHHALQAGIMDKAVSYQRRAGSRAFRRSANPEAVVWFERALTSLQQLPQDRTTIEHGIDLRIDLRDALMQSSEWDRVRDYLFEAETLARNLGDRRREGWVASHLANYYVNTGDPARAIEFGTRALAAATTVADTAIEAWTNFYLSRAYNALGDYTAAATVSQRNVELLDSGAIGRLHISLSVLSHCAWASSLAELGQFVEATAHANEGARIADATELAFPIIAACLASGTVRLLQGDLEPAILSLERCLDLSKSRNIQLYMVTCEANLGHAYVLSGRFREGLEFLEHAVGQEVSARNTTYMSGAFLAAGRTEQAHCLAVKAHTLSSERKQRGNEAYALKMLGEVAAHLHPAEAVIAETYYKQAMALAGEIGMRPLVAHCRLGLSKLHRNRGDRGPAQEHLTKAMEMYREMDMAYWLQRAVAELGEPSASSGCTSAQHDNSAS
jgi:class 3 adenylate cyclase/tetratricopeptide (TPR) repeat protein